jgi:hypothetical protein
VAAQVLVRMDADLNRVRQQMQWVLPAAAAAGARNRPPGLSPNVVANRKRVLSRDIRSLLRPQTYCSIL